MLVLERQLRAEERLAGIMDLAAAWGSIKSGDEHISHLRRVADGAVLSEFEAVPETDEFSAERRRVEQGQMLAKLRQLGVVEVVEPRRVQEEEN